VDSLTGDRSVARHGRRDREDGEGMAVERDEASLGPWTWGGRRIVEVGDSGSCWTSMTYLTKWHVIKNASKSIQNENLCGPCAQEASLCLVTRFYAEKEY
jgi:hypothetical protein